MPWEALVRDLGVISIVAMLVGYLGKQTIQQAFDKRLQAYQTELDKESIRFSGLHEKRGEVISTFYTKMTVFDEDMKGVVDPMILRGDSRQEMIDDARASGEDFRLYYQKHKLYFPPDVCATMESLLSKYREMFHDFSVRKIHDPSAPNSSSDDIEQWQKNWKSLTENEIPEMQSELEDQFRDILGVEYESRQEYNKKEQQ